jgi:hypothetical protein
VNAAGATTVYTAMTDSSSVTKARVSRHGAATATATARLRPRVTRVASNATMIVGAALVGWSAAIHLDLWHAGYRSIATIGPLFLLQAVSGFALALVIAVLRRLVPAVAGACFLASTLGGLVLSAQVGLFGFKESYGAPFAHLAIIVEVAGIVVLGVASVLRIRWGRNSRTSHTQTES